MSVSFPNQISDHSGFRWFLENGFPVSVVIVFQTLTEWRPRGISNLHTGKPKIEFLKIVRKSKFVEQILGKFAS